MKYNFKAKIWIYPGGATWHFITVPKKESSEIKKKFGKNSRGFGSLPVDVTIGETNWKTSVFPDRKSGTYLLPLKAVVRKKEGIFESDEVKISLVL